MGVGFKEDFALVAAMVVVVVELESCGSDFAATRVPSRFVTSRGCFA